MVVAKIENQYVLEKVTQSNAIRKYQYKYIHFNSNDPRGIDVALIYQPRFFSPYQYKTYSLKDANHFQNYATRDILLVKGQLQAQWVYVLVNHWPSRRGGSNLAKKNRIWAATTCKRIMDSIHLRVLQAGVRLAGLLDKIIDKDDQLTKEDIDLRERISNALLK